MFCYLKTVVFVLLLVCCKSSPKQSADVVNDVEPHRPQFHFSPKQKWMNDPNGMVFFNNVYHLYYQYYPDSTVWGPMHWGHATTTDLVNWQHQPVALYPDSLGYIFSGSAVVDSNNTSGFGRDGKIPLVAIFTHHDPAGEKRGSKEYQQQSIAYSLDEGRTWTKYSGNPVLKNPGIKDFRDPKVCWYEPSKKWIMTLAVLDRISFYSSPDLKSWTKESEFGKDAGAHGGVWECPDLFPLTHDGRTTWVLLVSINPGGPNGGSATQYFLGQFDGKNFTSDQTNTKWIDHGPDDYAGVTWSNTGDRKIFLGWMSNWQYAQAVPTKAWRSAMTVPRELSLADVNGELYLVSKPVNELSSLQQETVTFTDINVTGAHKLDKNIDKPSALAQLELVTSEPADFSIVLSNSKGEEFEIGYDNKAKQFYADRAKSGATGFETGFARRHTAPRIATSKNIKMVLVCDVASVELFADEGLTAMSEIFFPTEPFAACTIRSANGISIDEIKYTRLKAASIR